MTEFFLNSEWISCFNKFSKLIVGFSGGLDSTVLLHVLCSQSTLRAKITAVYIHHGISPNATVWERHCERVCVELNIPFLSYSAEFDRSANVEEGARIARYAFFSSLIGPDDCLLLGHHMDDQAETLLLQLFRGAGVEGLASMASSSSLGLGTLARPMLFHSRQQIEHYANSHSLKWIEDESNQDIKYSRNYLRQQIMPLLLKKWPEVAGNIARAAGHCQQAKMNLNELALHDHQGISLAQNSLLITPLKNLSIERITNVLRVWLRKNKVQMCSAVIMKHLIHNLLLARSDASPEITWGNVSVHRYRDVLYIKKTNKKKSRKPCSIEWSNFPSPLLLEAFNIHLIASEKAEGLIIPSGALLTIKLRQGGETIRFHGQTKQLKKLFQEWGIPPWQRDSIPLIYINDQLAVVVGYAVSDLFYSGNRSMALIAHPQSPHPIVTPQNSQNRGSVMPMPWEINVVASLGEAM